MSALIGHGPLLNELRRLAVSPEPPHAILLDGPESTGRTLLARTYAQILNCLERDARPLEEMPCGVCRPCRLIEEQKHADVIDLGIGETLCHPRPGDSHDHDRARDIRICQVRGLIDVVSRFPLEARTRVIIIDPAESMRPEAQNSLLKTLEEPPPHTALILLTAAPQDLLDTVLSRCRRLEIRPVPRAAVEAALLERGYDPAIAKAASEQANGRPGLALRLAQEPSLLDDRDRLLDRFAEVAAGGLKDRFAYADRLADRWRGDPAGVRKELATWDYFWERELRAATGDGEKDEALAAARALKAISTCRDNLTANVIARAAVGLMVMSFPRRTLAAPSTEEPVHA
jgi:DNA polymerase-3 subunit delta'